MDKRYVLTGRRAHLSCAVVEVGLTDVANPPSQGPLTRIASGCTDEQKQQLEKIYAKLDGGRNKFRLHVTPDFSVDKATGKRYVFYNK